MPRLKRMQGARQIRKDPEGYSKSRTTSPMTTLNSGFYDTDEKQREDVPRKIMTAIIHMPFASRPAALLSLENDNTNRCDCLFHTLLTIGTGC